MAGLSGALKGFGRSMMNKPMGAAYDAVSGGFEDAMKEFEEMKKEQGDFGAGQKEFERDRLRRLGSVVTRRV